MCIHAELRYLKVGGNVIINTFLNQSQADTCWSVPSISKFCHTK